MDIFTLFGMVLVPVLAVVFIALFFIKQYRRCPSNRILVIYGKVSGNRAARCIHGGGTFVIPLLQDYGYLSLDPMTREIDLKGALAKNNIRVNIAASFTLGISTDPTLMQNAAERLLGLNTQQTLQQAEDIITGQLRLVIASMDIEDLNQDRDAFLEHINRNVGTELSKVGLEVINVNIRDITDEAGYIKALGQKAAAEAVQNASIQVAQQMKIGETGVSMANREKDVAVAQQRAEAEIGKKEQDQKQRTQVAAYEAQAVEGENTSQIKIADTNAELAEKRAEAKRRSEVAAAEAQKKIFEAERDRETARLQKEEVVAQEIEKRKIEIEAEAQKQKVILAAQAEADAIRLKYAAEAEGIEKVMTAKAAGYDKLMKTFGDNKEIAPTMMMIEKLPDIVAKQVDALKNIKIDKVTVWENGGTGEHATSNFLRGMMTALPPVHELAKQAGVSLPQYLGTVFEAAQKPGQIIPHARTPGGEAPVTKQ